MSKELVQFLQGLSIGMGNIQGEVGSIISLVENLCQQYDEWAKQNPDVSRSEVFKALARDLQILYQTCKFISHDCVDVQHSISECDKALN